jgi:sulfite exporter TauE/SafE
MYDYLISAQNWILTANAGLLPLFAILFSFLNSWHCALMCGPMINTNNKRSTSQLLAFRVVNYTFMGALFGFIGSRLKDSLEYKAIGVFAFILFSIITAFFVLPMLIPKLKLKINNSVLNKYRGMFWGLIPCHLLMYYYGIAALTSSVVTGALLLFVHAVMTTPALTYSNFVLQKIKMLPKSLGVLVKYVLALLIAINLLYFWGSYLHSSDEAKTKILFCF